MKQVVSDVEANMAIDLSVNRNDGLELSDYPEYEEIFSSFISDQKVTLPPGKYVVLIGGLVLHHCVK